MSENYDKITLEDVEVAIRILEAFIGKMNRAKYTLARISRLAGTTSTSQSFNPLGLTFDDVVKIATAVKEKEKGVSEGGEDEGKEIQLTDEDIEAFRHVLDKVKGKV